MSASAAPIASRQASGVLTTEGFVGGLMAAASAGGGPLSVSGCLASQECSNPTAKVLILLFQMKLLGEQLRQTCFSNLIGMVGIDNQHRQVVAKLGGKLPAGPAG